MKAGHINWSDSPPWLWGFLLKLINVCVCCVTREAAAPACVLFPDLLSLLDSVAFCHKCWLTAPQAQWKCLQQIPICLIKASVYTTMTLKQLALLLPLFAPPSSLHFVLAETKPRPQVVIVCNYCSWYTKGLFLSFLPCCMLYLQGDLVSMIPDVSLVCGFFV